VKAGDLVMVSVDSRRGFRHGTMMFRNSSKSSIVYVHYGTILLVTGDAFTTDIGNRHIPVLHPEFGTIECEESSLELVRN
jgi:hypothetical protein